MAAVKAQILCGNGERKDFVYPVGEGDGARGHAQLLEALGSLKSRLNDELTVMVEAERAVSNSGAGTPGAGSDDGDEEGDDDDEDESEEPIDKKAKT